MSTLGRHPPPSLFNSLSFLPSTIFFLHWLPGISSTQPVHLSKCGSSPCSCADVSVRGEGGVSPPRRAHSFVSYYTSAGVVAVGVHQHRLLPPPQKKPYLPTTHTDTGSPVAGAVPVWSYCDFIVKRVVDINVTFSARLVPILTEDPVMS